MLNAIASPVPKPEGFGTRIACHKDQVSTQPEERVLTSDFPPAHLLHAGGRAEWRQSSVRPIAKTKNGATPAHSRPARTVISEQEMNSKHLSPTAQSAVARSGILLVSDRRPRPTSIRSRSHLWETASHC